MFVSISLLLHKNFPLSSSTADSNKRWYEARSSRTPNPRKHNAIQKSHVQRFLAAINISIMLSTAWDINKFSHHKLVNVLHEAMYDDVGLLKFVIKSNSVLLEDERNKDTSQRDYWTIFMYIELTENRELKLPNITAKACPVTKSKTYCIYTLILIRALMTAVNLQFELAEVHSRSVTEKETLKQK